MLQLLAKELKVFNNCIFIYFKSVGMSCKCEHFKQAYFIKFVELKFNLYFI